MHKKIFREYDIRGIVGVDLFIDQVYNLTRALVVYLLRMDPSLKKIVVARDGRIHSEKIYTEIIRALGDSGIDSLCIGICPTPVLYFATHTLDVSAGIMVTASHNGPAYNGLKIVCARRPVWGKELQEVYDLYATGAFMPVYNGYQGVKTECAEVLEQYVNWLVDAFDDLVGSNVKIVFDCANGAAGSVMPRLVDRMQWRGARIIFGDIDGNFPHHAADPVVYENVQELRNYVKNYDAVFGCGFDGDGDRMAVVTAKGRHLIGDQLLPLYVQDVLNKHAGASIVYDIKCSDVVGNAITCNGGVPIVSPSGHTIIKSIMRSHQSLLGGELSCHFFFADDYFGYDDGIYAAMRLIRIVQNRGQALDCLVDKLPIFFTTPEWRVPCDNGQRVTAMAQIDNYFMRYRGARLSRLDGIKVTLPHGWGLIRPSNTQEVLCIRCESSTKEGLHAVIQDFIEAMEPLFGREFLIRELQQNNDLKLNIGAGIVK